MQVIATFTHGAGAVLPAGTPESATDFFGLMTGYCFAGSLCRSYCPRHCYHFRVEIVVGCDAMRLIRPTVQSPRRPDKSRQRRIRHRLSNTPTGVFISPDHGQTGRRASLRLVVVDAFVQLVAGLHGVDDVFCVPSWRRTL